MKFAAIDIGSNAVRLLFTHVHEIDGKAVFRKSSLVRLPVRLGEDVFKTKNISERNTERLAKSMLAFRNLIEVHEVVSFRACATSAMREAQNGNQVVDFVSTDCHRMEHLEIIENERYNPYFHKLLNLRLRNSEL